MTATYVIDQDKRQQFDKSSEDFNHHIEQQSQSRPLTRDEVNQNLSLAVLLSMILIILMIMIAADKIRDIIKERISRGA